jgi:SAM-dependent methyltransferase
MASPLASPTPWDLVAQEYAEVTTPFFARYAEVALDRTGVRAQRRVLDIAAGPGTLSLLAAKRGCQTTAIDFAPAMIDELRAQAAHAQVTIAAQVADGQALPFPDATFDAAFSMFGLIFFPDRAQGFREMLRALVPGGVGAISSWQPMERFPLLSDIFAALRDRLPNLPFGGGKAPLGEPAEIVAEMSAAGFDAIQVEEVSATEDVSTLDEAWAFMSRGSAPFALLQKSLGESAWHDVERDIVATLRKKYGPGPQRLTMTAYLGVGRKPG